MIVVTLSIEWLKYSCESIKLTFETTFNKFIMETLFGIILMSVVIAVAIWCVSDDNTDDDDFNEHY